MTMFRKGCGMWELEVGPPAPRWARIRWDGEELRLMHATIDDLKDLRFLIDRALEQDGRDG